jgi:phosphoribosylformimino-5-aminoimidazole carboxamide ribonucleotide (ProFAR) isomerase
MDDATVFSDDPVEVAGRWVEAGARRLHVVDLDGAVSGEPRNAGIISEIVASIPGSARAGGRRDPRRRYGADLPGCRRAVGDYRHQGGECAAFRQ